MRSILLQILLAATAASALPLGNDLCLETQLHPRLSLFVANLARDNIARLAVNALDERAATLPIPRGPSLSTLRARGDEDDMVGNAWRPPGDDPAMPEGI